MTVREKAQLAKSAAISIGILGQQAKIDTLLAMANALEANEQYIIDANAIDMQNAKQKGIKASLLDRLMLNKQRIEAMADGLRQVAALPDPVGRVLSMWDRPNGLKIGQKRVPIGLIGMIYEARPNVTCDAIGLCVKSGNAVLLRSGSEAISSSVAIVAVLKDAANTVGYPIDGIQILEDTSREAANEMMGLSSIVDVLIPRGGAGLIKTVVENSRVPIIETGTGNCHVYVDSAADINMAINIVNNAKTSRVSVCNAAESLVVHASIAEEFLPKILQKLSEQNVELRGCNRTCEIIPVNAATEEDYSTEYNDYIMSVKIVDNIDEAIAHINKHSTHHSEAIVTESYNASQKFLDEIDSACVYVNASTRFTDGCEFGFGAEIGISTQKLHARGPVGLEQLTTIKYIIYGNGQIR